MNLRNIEARADLVANAHAHHADSTGSRTL